jgi:hypothetical protein
MRRSYLDSLPKGKVVYDVSIIVEPPLHDSISALGELVVDRSADTFQFVALDHLGVTLLQISGDRNGSSVDYAVPELAEHKELLDALGHEIRGMYFDLVPSPMAQPDISENAVWYSDKTPEGTVQYELAGQPTVLLEKRLDGFLGPLWRMRYYQYTRTPLGVYPYGIVMDNDRYHYRIIVKNRAMH